MAVGEPRVSLTSTQTEIKNCSFRAGPSVFDGCRAFIKLNSCIFMYTDLDALWFDDNGEKRMSEDGHGTSVRKTERHHEQKLVDEHFNAESAFWRDTYQRKDVLAEIFRERQSIALEYVDELSLPRTARVLEIGCGAGFMAIALAFRGFTVEAVDHAPAMIELAQRHIRQNEMQDRVHATVQDVHELAYDDCSFDLIVALGLVTWLHDLRKALMEIARVLAPGGYVVLSIYNRYGARALLDPAVELRERVKRRIERAGLRSPPRVAQPHRYSIGEFNRYLNDANLTSIKKTNIGFGPFTLLKRNIFSDRTGVKIHHRLQQYADIGYPILRSTGSQYVVLARKGAIARKTNPLER
jgi:2-polyprenyl-3-methyl-5-hydroxy-6-metoxy-1,4-benzoquinol methylase